MVGLFALLPKVWCRGRFFENEEFLSAFQRTPKTGSSCDKVTIYHVEEKNVFHNYKIRRDLLIFSQK